jgi:hypothetical protein
MNIWKKLLTSGLLGVLASSCWGESDAGLPDPTRPAITETKPGDAANGASAPGPVLQSIILRKGLKSAAIISGQLVEVGQEIGGSRLIRVTESEVTLVSPAGKETLRLIPAVEKKSISEKSTVKSMGSNSKRTAVRSEP